MQGSTAPGAMALMTSGGPSELLERAALLDAAGQHRVDVVAQLTALEEQATAADQAAKQTLAAAETLKAEAATLLASAQQQESQARSQEATLAEQQEQYEAGLASAEQTLTALQTQRAAAETYAAQQQQAAAAAAAAAQRATSRTTTSPSSSSVSSSSSSSGSSSSSASSGSASSGSASSGSTSKPVAAAPAPPKNTTAGAPSGSTVERAVAAALSQKGVAYSWGGGGSNGPSYGISPDTNVYGFDCSGLTQYAYYQAGIQIGGTSRDQYYRFRNETVAVGDLQRGDLLFWDDGSANPNYLDIVHVAIYLGNGQMVEAPDRGLTVRVSTARTSSSTYFGAVRPTA
jgi:peptidoglycan DL-endopeptidase RipA